MPLILANTSSVEADLHRTDAKSSTLLHLPPERQWCDSWGCFDHCFPHSSLLIIFTMFAYGRLHLFSSSSAVCHCRKRTVPPAETVSYDAPPMREPAPVLVPPATADRGATTISTISPWGSLRDTFPKISTALRNTGGLHESPQGRAERLGQLIFRCAAEIHNAWSSLSVYPPCSSSLCRKIDLINGFPDGYSVPFTFKSDGLGRWGVRATQTGADTPYSSDSTSQEVTELLTLASPAGHPPARQGDLLSSRITFRSIPLYIPSRKLTFPH